MKMGGFSSKVRDKWLRQLIWGLTECSTFSPGLQQKGYLLTKQDGSVRCAPPSGNWEGEPSSGFVGFKSDLLADPI